MRGLNKVTLIGNLGQDPEVQVLDGHVPVAKFSLATVPVMLSLPKHLYRSGNSTRFNEAIEMLRQAQHDQLIYDDPATGQRHYMTEIIGEQVLMLDKKTGDVPPLAP